jgi:hypothetical protein
MAEDRKRYFRLATHTYSPAVKNILNSRESTRVPPGDTQLVRLSVGELGDGEYKFEARGTAPIQFQVQFKLRST